MDTWTSFQNQRPLHVWLCVCMCVHARACTLIQSLSINMSARCNSLGLVVMGGKGQRGRKTEKESFTQRYISILEALEDKHQYNIEDGYCGARILLQLIACAILF